MKHAATLIIMLVVVGTADLTAYAQENDSPKANVNLGMTMSAPVNPTARFVNLGLGLGFGAGYNFTRRHAVVGEFMWNSLYPNGDALAPIRTAFQNPSISAGSNLFAFTSNYRFELRGKTLGTYFIGGGGWYYRNAHLTQDVTTGTGIICTPVWLWYGFSCSSGTVTADQTIRSTSSSALGVNGGIGFTARVGDAPYRIYLEPRYHYAPTKGVSTQLIVVSIGIRY
jgi:outer membrane protein with beta-barrel domain